MNKINGKETKVTHFAYDGCHKIYLIEDKQDMKDAEELGYDIFPIEDIWHCWNYSCELRFINNWKLTETYIRQFEEVSDKDFELEGLLKE